MTKPAYAALRELLDREDRLVALLKESQNRLRNQGDIKERTHEINIQLHDDIERELGGSIFLGAKVAEQPPGEGWDGNVKVIIGDERVEAFQITEKMFDRSRFPVGIELRHVQWEGTYARELELKHGALEVPFLLTEEGARRLKLSDWVVTFTSGEKRIVDNHAFGFLKHVTE